MYQNTQVSETKEFKRTYSEKQSFYMNSNWSHLPFGAIVEVSLILSGRTSMKASFVFRQYL